MTNPYQTRRNHIILLQKKMGQDALLFTDLKNIFYLCAFSGSDGVLLLSNDETILFVDARYTNQARREAQGVQVWEYREKVEAVAAVIKQKGIKKVGVEAEAISVDLCNRLKKSLLKKASLAAIEQLDKIRMLKDAEEVAKIRTSAGLVAKVVPKVLERLAGVVTEKEIAAAIEYYLKLAGSDAMPFEVIAAAGENSAFPHAKPTTRKLEAGDVLLIDCGAITGGYASDETMVFFVDKVSKEKERVFNAVKDAHDEAIAKIRAGVLAGDIDAIARNRLASYGLDGYFTHSTGHGVGLAIHEKPRLAPNSQEVLKAGMVVTVEPGVYIPNKFGIRIEDTVLVEENSCEILTKISKARTTIYF